VRVGWPCPTSALAVAAREIGLGLRRFISNAGQRGCAKRYVGTRRKLFHWWGRCSHRGSGLGGLLELVEDVVGAAGELACDGEGGALAAAAALDVAVEVVVGAAGLAGVVGRLGEGPAELG